MITRYFAVVDKTFINLNYILVHVQVQVSFIGMPLIYFIAKAVFKRTLKLQISAETAEQGGTCPPNIFKFLKSKKKCLVPPQFNTYSGGPVQ